MTNRGRLKRSDKFFFNPPHFKKIELSNILVWMSAFSVLFIVLKDFKE